MGDGDARPDGYPRATTAPTRAEREVADLLPIGADEETARAVLGRVPLWFHTFSLDEGSIYTPGVARDHRYRIPVLPDDLSGKSVLDVGTFDGFYAFLAEARGRGAWSRWTTSSTATWVLGALGHRARGAARASGRSGACSDSEVEYRRLDAFELDRARRRSFDVDLLLRDPAPGREPAGPAQGAAPPAGGAGYVLLETYGVANPELEHEAAMHVCEPGEVYARDDFVYWGFTARAWLAWPATRGSATWRSSTTPADRRSSTDHRHAGPPRVTRSHSRNTGGPGVSAMSLCRCRPARFTHTAWVAPYGPDPRHGPGRCPGAGGRRTRHDVADLGRRPGPAPPRSSTLGTTLDGWAHRRKAAEIRPASMLDHDREPTAEDPLTLDELSPRPHVTYRSRWRSRRRGPGARPPHRAPFCERHAVVLSAAASSRSASTPRPAPRRWPTACDRASSCGPDAPEALAAWAVSRGARGSRSSTPPRRSSSWCFRLAGLSVSTGTVNDAQFASGSPSWRRRNGLDRSSGRALRRGR